MSTAPIDAPRGLLITLEGPEGSGKSTQIERLAARLRASGVRVRTTREPGGTPLSEEIRRIVKHARLPICPDAELLLMNAARAQLLADVIRPARLAGEVVLCDRYIDSSLAYQGYGRGLDLERVRALTAFTVGDERPDLTLVLLVPPDVSRQRQARRDAAAGVSDRFGSADASFHQRVAEGYRAIAREESDRVRSIDGTQAVEAVEAALWAEVEPLVNRWREARARASG